MNVIIIIQMAWRNIWRNKVRSLIIISSVAIGLVAGLFVLSLYKGILEDRVRTVIDREVSHLQVHHVRFKEDFDPKYVIPGKDELIEHLHHLPTVKVFTSRTVAQGMLATGTGSSAIQLVGVDPEQENQVSGLNAKLKDGKGFSNGKKNQLLIGKKLADKMHLKVGSKAILTFIDKESNIVSGAFRVAGIYQTDNTPMDERIAFVKQDDLRLYLSLDGEVHEIAILLQKDGDVEDVQAALKSKYPELKIESWKEISPETKLMIETTDQYSLIFIIIIMLALSFGIVNTMLMAVLERSREIGMLLALGMNRVKIFSMILTETVFLTITGVPTGVFATWVIVKIYHRHGLDISALGGQAMSEFGFSSMIYPAFPWEKILSQMLIVLMAALLSSLIPAIKAIGLRPVEALQK
ncbi:efflux ABC transporter, permease protein [Fulvivirga imtechensis AK7]|uniref:Efflux ABC transporter, permease protein n=1 Tax=Fulvivirga imtechensis AK7 TaxID=1237149 RepID=L8JSH3_9BACT|nr:FtsX-like permease family protein [Fulvivirga imtechensis]ELR71926.1 efflux ABC transporter, permease protein [Fulvivirga imtechensis AK7]